MQVHAPQRVTIQGRISQMSATHLASHPRMKRPRAELSGLRRQIRTEARKIVDGLQNEAEIAGARELSLKASLADLTTTSGGQSKDNIRLRELVREARASKDILNTFLARQRDASSRQDLSAISAGATIYSKAYPSNIAAFPKKLPVTLLVMMATAMLTVFGVITKALITGEAVPQVAKYAGQYFEEGAGAEHFTADEEFEISEEEIEQVLRSRSTRNKRKASFEAEPDDKVDYSIADTSLAASEPPVEINKASVFGKRISEVSAIE